ncbi:MAG: ABC transporter substrate-binding protein [Rhodococcus sp. (in: high G+C Gram-positive bacteria)]|nr:ABC transporter substrate-binding protein [Rhodococcus sp. (in: high G+C Gram-positive bacteria)]
MRIKRAAVVTTAVLMSASLLAACGGGGSGSGGSADGIYSIYIGEPENPLVPGNTTESEGSQVLEALFTPLVTFNDEDNSVEYNGVAESVESEDNTTWTVKLKDGWTFHDGTPVTARSPTPRRGATTR